MKIWAHWLYWTVIVLAASVGYWDCWHQRRLCGTPATASFQLPVKHACWLKQTLTEAVSGIHVGVGVGAWDGHWLPECPDADLKKGTKP